ncbi:unnamed protein product [Darwinula stevensoni]|uniref:AIG1-type G domain-containing protein n=1 Tax=Darwinula stevensoni TaxID=69355 RepID=A0A7R8XBB1_9CRUS|nr:unnamed protein product [Darwinula stevensoni]CAG0892679.1 unnamed protein product [Darwinula stevensoni]
MMAANRQLKICLVGVAGNGKSTLGNILLGLEPDDDGGFETSSGARSCTLGVQWKDGNFRGRAGQPIRVIDTPGHGDGEGRDKELRRNMVEELKKQETIDAFIWVKNAQDPRYTKTEAEYFQILIEIFGGAYFHNFVVVFSRWSFSEKEEQKRNKLKKPVTFEGVKAELWDSFLRDYKGNRSLVQVPMMAIDALYDSSDKSEVDAFENELRLLWHTMNQFSAKPVSNIEMALTKIEKLKKQVEEDQDKVKKMKSRLRQMEQQKQRELELQEAEYQRRIKEAESKIKEEKERMEGPPWVKFISFLATPLAMLLGRRLAIGK